MKTLIKTFLLFFLGAGVLSANMLDKYSRKMDEYHKTLILGGAMDVVVYRGFIDAKSAQDFIEKLRKTELTGTPQERRNFIELVDKALMKNDSYSKITLKHNYSDKGYKCVLGETVFKDENGRIKTENARIETSLLQNTLKKYYGKDDTLVVSKAPSVDWYSPSYFNFAITNPMMLDFNRFLIPDKSKNQTIEFIPDGENAMFIKGTVKGCEKLRIVIRDGFPYAADSVYYASPAEDRVLRSLFYRYYQPVADCNLEFTYPSVVVIIDAQRDNLCRVEMYDISRHSVDKGDGNFEIKVGEGTKILTDK